MSSAHQEFYEANAGIIESIASDASRIIDISSDPMVVENNGTHGDATIVQGQFVADDFQWRYPQLPEDIAREVSEHVAAGRNRVLRHKASTMFTVLIAGASLTDTMDQYEAGQLTREEALEQGFLHYSHGIYRATQEVAPATADLLEVDHAQLEGLAVYGTADHTGIEVIDQIGLSRKLVIHRLGSTVTNVALHIKPETDPLMWRCAELLGEGVADLLPILVGRHSTEEELDAAIASVWLDYQGTSKEQEITPVLDEIRDRAIAVKQSSDLVIEHDASLPTVEQLTEFAELLSN